MSTARWSREELAAWESRRHGKTCTQPYAAPAKPIIRQAKPQVNRWEAEFAAIARARHGDCLHEQSFSLRLGNGAWFKPDIFVFDDNPMLIDRRPVAYEVKGFAREAAVARIKIAAGLYPEIRFVLVRKRRKAEGGGWQEQEVLP